MIDPNHVEIDIIPVPVIDLATDTPTPTVTPTFTPTDTPTPTNTLTPTRTPTPTPIPLPPADTNLLTNPTFTNGLTGWLTAFYFATTYNAGLLASQSNTPGYGMSTEYSRSTNALVIESQSARDGNGQLIPLPFSLSFENPIGNIGSLSWQTHRFTRLFTVSDINFPTDRPILQFLNGLEPVPTIIDTSVQRQRVEFILCP